jgi:hypothetical protein
VQIIAKKGFDAHFSPVLMNSECNFLYALLVLDCACVTIPHLVRHLHFLLSRLLPLLKIWKYKCNDVTFCGFNCLIYILKFFKTIVIERENGDNLNSLI